MQLYNNTISSYEILQYYDIQYCIIQYCITLYNTILFYRLDIYLKIQYDHHSKRNHDILHINHRICSADQTQLKKVNPN